MTIKESRSIMKYLIWLYGGNAKVELVYQNLKLIVEMGEKLRQVKNEFDKI